MHLLQLAGNQAWPNFLPILALKPTSVTFLTSVDASHGFHRGVKSIQAACSEMGTDFSLRICSTLSNTPTTEECRQVLGSLEEKVDCINLTGGTKPMSLAAYDLARQAEIPAFYLDTRRRDSPVEAVTATGSGFTDGESWGMAAIVGSITVPVALKAQGFPVPETFKLPSESWVKFSVMAAEIRMTPEADREISKAVGQLRVQLMEGGGSMPKKGKLRKVLQLPIRAIAGTAWHDYLEAACRAGIISRLDTEGCDHAEFLLLDADLETTPADQLRSRADGAFKLLEGIWFEIALLEHLRKKACFSDIRWSVEADHLQDSAASSRGETDLVAFNTSDLTLHFISCKTTGPHSSSLDHIQGLRRRATKEGGKFSKAELWIFRPKSDEHRRDLESHCKEQGVSLRVFADA